MSSQSSMDRYEAADVLLKYVYSGVLGSIKGKAVDYALMETTDTSYAYSVALEPATGPIGPLDRYNITVNTQTKETSPPEKIEITHEDLRKAVFAATGKTVVSAERFTDEGFSISYKIKAIEKPDFESTYIIQLRHHGNVASMDALMQFVQKNSPQGTLPMPAVFPIPGEAQHQKSTGFGRQITQFVPGVLMEQNYLEVSYADRIELVHEMALAW